ncbi:MAG TPA: ABC transporter permease [Gaiellaceae bacterium]|nr:ABC transporter permease [Gaiellaceae bacterium]
MNTLSDTWFLILRRWRNLMREPIWIVMMVVQPMVWLVLYGQLFRNVTKLGGFGTGSYVTFLAPAIVIMNAFFGASWSGMSMINDLEHKVIERFLATPASRLAIILSQIGTSAITSVIQSLLILIVSLILGVRVSEGVLGWAVIILAGALVNSAFAGFSQAVALLTRREATMIAVASSIQMPLLFLSTTMIAAKQMPHWMQVTSKFNPLEWGVRAARAVALPGTSWSTVGWHILLLLGLSALTCAWATRAFRGYQRTL